MNLYKTYLTEIKKKIIKNKKYINFSKLANPYGDGSASIKIRNFFLGSLLGMFPQIFVWASLGSGLDKIIESNQQAPSLRELLSSSEIYIPVLGFIMLLLLSLILKNIYYKK